MSPVGFDVAFGPVVARIEAEPALEAVHAVLRRWFTAGLREAGGPPDVLFSLGRVPVAEERSRGAVLFVGSGSLDRRSFSNWDGRAWTTTRARDGQQGGTEQWCSRLENGPMLRVAERVPTFLLRLTHEHYFSCDEIRASTFLYRHIVPIVQLALLRRRATFVHASAVRRRSGGGILLFGWGGCGKTSACTSLHLTEPERWQFISDDLAIVDDSGRVHHSPLPLNVFPYNTGDFPLLEERVLGGMGPVERLQWKVRARFLGGDGVARRIPAWEPPEPATDCRLSLCAHLQRSSDSTPVAEECEPAAIARISKSILAYELRQSLAMLTIANAFQSPQPLGLPSLDELMQAAEAILASALRESRVVSIRVPRAYRPLELGAYVASLWEEPGAR